MRIHSPSPHKLAQSKSSDYFFNYFTLGVVSTCTSPRVRMRLCTILVLSVSHSLVLLWATVLTRLNAALDLNAADGSNITKKVPHSSKNSTQSEECGMPDLASFFLAGFQSSPEVSIPGADQKNRSLSDEVVH